MSKKTKFKKSGKAVSIFVGRLTITGVLCGLLFYFLYFGKIYPGVHIAQFNVGGKTPEETITLLNASIPQTKEVTLVTQSNKFTIPLSSIDFTFDTSQSASAAYQIGRTGNILFDTRQIISSIVNNTNLGLRINLNEQKLKESLSVIAGAVATDPVYPSIKLTNGQAVIDPGKKGEDVDLEKLRLDIGESLAFNKNEAISIPKKAVDPTLTAGEVERARVRAQALIKKSLSLNFEFTTFSYKDDKLISFLDPKGGYSDEALEKLVNQIALQINRDPQNPTFNFLPAQGGNDGRVQEFAPAKEGITTDTEMLKNQIISSLQKLELEDPKDIVLAIPVEKTAPKVTTSEVNNLGIKELIGRGTSRFQGSIANRIHNVNLAASRLNGVLIEPGKILSFNDALGDVSKFTGFKEAYVIKDGKTILGDGGGVCQVSTTLFRAALNAGLPIVERRAHAYRVGYYEQDSGPGLDATVFGPTTDLKFENNTANHILIQARTDTKNLTLTFELYGTKDGRTATITKPVITNRIPAPPTQYIDDPTLPVGTRKLTEHAAAGARVVFTYEVQKDGSVMYQKQFVSNYRPWPAVYLVGTRI